AVRILPEERIERAPRGDQLDVDVVEIEIERGARAPVLDVVDVRRGDAAVHAAGVLETRIGGTDVGRLEPRIVRHTVSRQAGLLVVAHGQGRHADLRGQLVGARVVLVGDVGRDVE